MDDLNRLQGYLDRFRKECALASQEFFSLTNQCVTRISKDLVQKDQQIAELQQQLRDLQATRNDTPVSQVPLDVSSEPFIRCLLLLLNTPALVADIEQFSVVVDLLNAVCIDNPELQHAVGDTLLRVTFEIVTRYSRNPMQKDYTKEYLSIVYSALARGFSLCSISALKDMYVRSLLMRTADKDLPISHATMKGFLRVLETLSRDEICTLLDSGPSNLTGALLSITTWLIEQIDRVSPDSSGGLVAEMATTCLLILGLLQGASRDSRQDAGIYHHTDRLWYVCVKHKPWMVKYVQRRINECSSVGGEHLKEVFAPRIEAAKNMGQSKVQEKLSRLSVLEPQQIVPQLQALLDEVRQWGGVWGEL